MKTSENAAVVCDSPESIQLFQLLSIRGRLQLEQKGIKFRLPTTPVVAKMMGVERVTRAKALEYVQSRIDELTAPIVEDPA